MFTTRIITSDGYYTVNSKNAIFLCDRHPEASGGYPRIWVSSADFTVGYELGFRQYVKMTDVKNKKFYIRLNSEGCCYLYEFDNFIDMPADFETILAEYGFEDKSGEKHLRVFPYYDLVYIEDVISTYTFNAPASTNYWINALLSDIIKGNVWTLNIGSGYLYSVYKLKQLMIGQLASTTYNTTLQGGLSTISTTDIFNLLFNLPQSTATATRMVGLYGGQAIGQGNYPHIFVNPSLYVNMNLNNTSNTTQTPGKITIWMEAYEYAYKYKP